MAQYVAAHTNTPISSGAAEHEKPIPLAGMWNGQQKKAAGKPAASLL